jgi:hypothetical protein
MSPGFLSDKRAVVSVVIALYLILVAIVIIRAFSLKVSLVVFGAALVLLLIAYLLDTADEVKEAPAMTATPKSESKQLTAKKPAKKADPESPS